MESFGKREKEEKITHFCFLQNFHLQKKQSFETKFRKLFGKEKAMGNDLEKDCKKGLFERISYMF